MPGHKHTAFGGGLLAELWGEGVVRSDLSEMGGLDYLHSPESSLKEAQSLAARAFGAGATYFLINGTTAGNQAAILASVPPGKKLLLPRASHRSVYASLLLADAEPVYVPPIVQRGSALPLETDLAAVERLLATVPDIAAIHITSPSYYGFCSDLTGIANLAKRHGVVLIVDEAHGSHFAFHPAFPLSAMQAGADIAVQSTHKTIGSLTQSSMLHAREDFPYFRQLQQSLAMLQSSSPSALLLASLDDARALMAMHGREMLGRTLDLTTRTRSEIDAIPGLQCVRAEIVPATGRYRSDPTKMLIRVRDLGMTGFDAAAWLIAERGIEVELKDLDHILCTITIADTEPGVAELIAALRDLSEQAAPGARGENERGAQPVWPATPIAAMSLSDAFHAESEMVPFAEAVGRISAEFVIPYPPGIPVLLPGERITPDAADYALNLLKRGGRIVGPEDPRLQSLRVM